MRSVGSVSCLCFDSGVIISIMLMKMSFVPLFLSANANEANLSFFLFLLSFFFSFCFVLAASESMKNNVSIWHALWVLSLSLSLSFTACQSQIFLKNLSHSSKSASRQGKVPLVPRRAI